FFYIMLRQPLRSTLFPYTTLFRSISEDVLSSGSYCHEKFPAIEGKSLASNDPVLKSAQSGDVIDYYGPCDEDLTGKSQLREQTLDRKSTRLNSSHVSISYAVFCLK